MDLRYIDVLKPLWLVHCQNVRAHLQWPFIKSCMPRLVDSDMSPYVQHGPQLITPCTPEGHGLNLSEFPFRFHAYSAYMSCWHDWWRWSRPSFFNTPCFPRRGRTLVQLCVGVSETLSLLPRSWGNWKSEVAGIETGNTWACFQLSISPETLKPGFLFLAALLRFGR